MPILLDLHVLAQAVLYFVSMACGLVVSIPLGLTTVNFHGHCLLYTECHWQNASFFTASFTSRTTCNFPVYLAVFAGILYATGMGIYYIYALTRKDPNIGAQMWVLPFTLMATLVTVGTFIAACIISVGFKSFCDSFLKGKEDFNSPFAQKCSDGQHVKWYELNNPSVSFDGSTFYAYLHASQGAAWVLFLVWALQVGLGILRIVRNRRLRSQGMYADSAAENAEGGAKKAEDLENVAAVEPTA